MSTLQSLCNDPNVVIGLVSSALAGKGPCFANPSQKYTIGTDDHLSYSKSARLLDASRRLCNVMDAIVEVAALSSENAVLACGMRRDDTTSVHELVLCGLTPISSVTFQHINRIWTLMVENSALREKKLMKPTDMNFDCTLLDFALPDLRRRFQEGLMIQLEWRRKSDSMIVADDIDEDSYPTKAMILKCIAAFADVVDCMSVCNTLLQNVSAWNPDEAGTSFADWTKLRKSMAKLLQSTNHLLGLEAFKVWSFLTGEMLAIRDHLKRIARFQAHLEILRKFSHSKRHKPFFGRPLRITTVKALHPKSDALWPSSTHSWTDVRDHLYRKYRRTFIGSEDSHNFSLLPDRPDQLMVHPELTLYNYLYELSSREDPCLTYNYIAVSGLACKACSLWIRTYNYLHKPSGFGISGSNNEWVTDWCMPDLGRDDDKFCDYFIRRSLEVYFQFTRRAKISGVPDPFESWPGSNIRDHDPLHTDTREY